MRTIIISIRKNLRSKLEIVTDGARYSRMDQVKFVEDSL